MPFEARRITDPRALRALSHPVRLALIDALREEGPLTATQAAELVGESAANCSFHLRTLARYGFVDEAEGGRGRQRPWRLVSPAHHIPDAGELPGEAGIAAGALVEVLSERDGERHRTWLHTAPQYPERWRQASFYDSIKLQLTSEELEDLAEAVHGLMARFVGRTPEDRPPGAIPVQVTAMGFPTRIPQPAPERRSHATESSLDLDR
ncbi:MAG TPA: helix-turn-helix domain-containing protein [Acidimicrobiales bacterium]|jgi:predicted ArsR family transcriptional regulator|nr:helix-turn-helix domain-containing protein [Acidimicrobiales bacterium]